MKKKKSLGVAAFKSHKEILQVVTLYHNNIQ